jgi:hypothetical protein
MGACIGDMDEENTRYCILAGAGAMESKKMYRCYKNVTIEKLERGDIGVRS